MGSWKPAPARHGLGTRWARHGHSGHSGPSHDDSTSCLDWQISRGELTLARHAKWLGWAQTCPQERSEKPGVVGDLARLTRFERATPAFGGQYSIQLSY